MEKADCDINSELKRRIKENNPFTEDEILKFVH